MSCSRQRCQRCQCLDLSFSRGLYFGPKTIFIPPLPKMIFSPLSRHIFFQLLSWPFYLNPSLFCIYYILLLPIFSLFYPLSSFLFLLFLFLWHLPPVSLPLFLFFPQMLLADIFSPPGGYFPIFRPLSFSHQCIKYFRISELLMRNKTWTI